MSCKLTKAEKFYIEQHLTKKSIRAIASDLGRSIRDVSDFCDTLMWWNSRHEQVPIEWRGFKAEVDVELAPLILSLWQAGIATVNSCQENKPGIVWIQFPSTEDARVFLNLVAVHPDQGDDERFSELYHRVVSHGGQTDWQYTLGVFNRGVERHIVNDKVEETGIPWDFDVEETCIGPSDFEFSVSIRFPRTDLPVVLEMVRSRQEPPEEYMLIAGYCVLCRAKEVEMYGEPLHEACPRHTAAVKAAGCVHPAEYQVAVGHPLLAMQGE